jgi:hypothetical protein
MSLEPPEPTGLPDPDDKTAEPKRPARSRTSVIFYRTLGLGFVGLGAIGAVLPLMPTTVFLLLAVWAFARGSPELGERLYADPRFGPLLRDWDERRARQDHRRGRHGSGHGHHPLARRRPHPPGHRRNRRPHRRRLRADPTELSGMDPPPLVGEGAERRGPITGEVLPNASAKRELDCRPTSLRRAHSQLSALDCSE